MIPNQIFRIKSYQKLGFARIKIFSLDSLMGRIKNRSKNYLSVTKCCTNNNFLIYSVTGIDAPALHEEATNDLLATIRSLQRDSLANMFRNTFASQSQDRGHRRRRAGKPTKVVCVHITALPIGTASLKRVPSGSVGLGQQIWWLP